jgi:hypothetical protein
MATHWPAYARLWTVATAGQSAASYTTSGDTTVMSCCTTAARVAAVAEVAASHQSAAIGTDVESVPGQTVMALAIVGRHWRSSGPD